MLAGFLTYLGPQQGQLGQLSSLQHDLILQFVIISSGSARVTEKEREKGGEGKRERGLLRLRTGTLSIQPYSFNQSKIQGQLRFKKGFRVPLHCKGCEYKKKQRIGVIFFFFNQNTTLTWLRFSVQGWLGGLIVNTLVFFAISKRESFQYFIINYSICCSFLFSRFSPL